MNEELNKGLPWNNCSLVVRAALESRPPDVKSTALSTRPRCLPRLWNDKCDRQIDTNVDVMEYLKDDSVFIIPVSRWLLCFAADPMALLVVVAVVNELNNLAMLLELSQPQTTARKESSSICNDCNIELKQLLGFYAFLFTRIFQLGDKW